MVDNKDNKPLLTDGNPASPPPSEDASIKASTSSTYYTGFSLLIVHFSRFSREAVAATSPNRKMRLKNCTIK
jgi:hypothetical protein